MRRWLMLAGALLALAAPVRADDLEEICAKGHITIPPIIGLNRAQAVKGFNANCVAGYKLGLEPEDQPVLLERQQIYKCLCYVVRLEQPGGDPAQQPLYAKYHALMLTFLAYIGNSDAPAPAGPAPKCIISATPPTIDIPSTAQAVVVTGQVAAGSPATIEASRSDDGGTSSRPATVDAQGNFTTTFTYTVKADETFTAKGIVFTVKECGATYDLLYKRPVPGASLSPIDVDIDKDTSAHLTLTITKGVGDVAWTLTQNGADTAVTGTSGHSGSARIIGIDTPQLSNGARFGVRIQDASNPPVESNATTVVIKPTPQNPPVVKGQPFCNAAKTRVALRFLCDNPDGLPIEVEARMHGATKKGGLVTGRGNGNVVVLPFDVPETYVPPDTSYRVGLRAFYVSNGRRVLFFPVRNINVRLTGPVGTPNRVVLGDDPDPAGLGEEDGGCEMCECDLGETDEDGDGIDDVDDNCPTAFNLDQADTDDDGVGDACDDCRDEPNDDQGDEDQDGAGDVCDLCPQDATVTTEDADDDGLGDACDVCPDAFDPDQTDTDGDGVGDACDNCPQVANADQADDDQDGIGNACPDTDECTPETCCPDFPEPCGDECFDPCPRGQDVDPLDCTQCEQVDDVEPPVVEITSPESGSTVQPGATVQVGTRFTDGGLLDNGVVSGAFTVSGPAVASGPTPAGFQIPATPLHTRSFSFAVKSDLSQVSDLNIVITAQGRDVDGNQSATAEITVVATVSTTTVVTSTVTTTSTSTSTSTTTSTSTSTSSSTSTSRSTTTSSLTTTTLRTTTTSVVVTTTSTSTSTTIARALSITAPAASATVTADSVAVAGTVLPAPPAGATASIKVNGAVKATVPVSGTGAFSASVALAKVIALGDLKLTNPNLRVTTCGSRSTNVVVGNTKTGADVTNLITVDVSGAGAPLSGSVTVFHGVRVSRYKVTWTDCPPLNKDQNPGVVIGAGQSANVGTVDCGVTGADGFTATCSVKVDVTTTAGALSANSVWTFAVSSCP